MEAEGSRLRREKQQVFMVGRVSAVPAENPAGSIDEGRLKPPFVGNVDIPLAGAPAESDYLELTSYLMEDPNGSFTARQTAIKFQKNRRHIRTMSNLQLYHSV